jgi:protein O-mannosyl-transferase
VLCGSAWLVLRRSDALGLAGLCVLFPALLFVTEFATVWVQDAVRAVPQLPVGADDAGAGGAAPGRHEAQSSVPLGAGVACLFAALAFERVLSLRDALQRGADAAGKIDLRAGANAVGRWRPMLNLGAEYLEKGAYEAAYRHFAQAEALGEPLGSARFNMGVSRQLMNHHARALEEFERAEAKGFSEAALYYHRGESQYALRAVCRGVRQLRRGACPDRRLEAAEQHTRLRRAEAAVAIEDFDTAVATIVACSTASRTTRATWSVSRWRTSASATSPRRVDPRSAHRKAAKRPGLLRARAGQLLRRRSGRRAAGISTWRCARSRTTGSTAACATVSMRNRSPRRARDGRSDGW